MKSWAHSCSGRASMKRRSPDWNALVLEALGSPKNARGLEAGAGAREAAASVRTRRCSAFCSRTRQAGTAGGSPWPIASIRARAAAARAASRGPSCHSAKVPFAALEEEPGAVLLRQTRRIPRPVWCVMRVCCALAPSGATQARMHQWAEVPVAGMRPTATPMLQCVWRNTLRSLRPALGPTSPPSRRRR